MHAAEPAHVLGVSVYAPTYEPGRMPWFEPALPSVPFTPAVSYWLSQENQLLATTSCQNSGMFVDIVAGTLLDQFTSTTATLWMTCPPK